MEEAGREQQPPRRPQVVKVTREQLKQLNREDRQRKAEERRSRLLEAAQQATAAAGVEDAWMDRVVAAPIYRPTEEEWRDPLAYIRSIQREAAEYGICIVRAPLAPTVPGGLAMLAQDPAFKFNTRQQAVRDQPWNDWTGCLFHQGKRYSLQQYQDAACAAFAKRFGGLHGCLPARFIEREYWRERERLAGVPMYIDYGSDLDGTLFLPQDKLGSSRWNLNTLPLEEGSALRFCHSSSAGSAATAATGSNSNNTPATTTHSTALAAAGNTNDHNAANGSSAAIAAPAGSTDSGGASPSLYQTAAGNGAAAAGTCGRPIPGVSTPMLYVGQLFSTFCWHVEDHFMYSINYQHLGAAKTWYGVPASHADAFEGVARRTVYAEACASMQAAGASEEQIWCAVERALMGKTTMFSPRLLVENGVRVSRAVQQVGDYVVTFPRAYHAGFGNGFQVGEAVNFGMAEWWPFGEDARRRYRHLAQPAILPQEQLLCREALALAARCRGRAQPASPAGTDVAAKQGNSQGEPPCTQDPIDCTCTQGTGTRIPGPAAPRACSGSHAVSEPRSGSAMDVDVEEGQAVHGREAAHAEAEAAMAGTAEAAARFVDQAAGAETASLAASGVVEAAVVGAQEGALQPTSAAAPEAIPPAPLYSTSEAAAVAADNALAHTFVGLVRRLHHCRSLLEAAGAVPVALCAAGDPLEHCSLHCAACQQLCYLSSAVLEPRARPDAWRHLCLECAAAEAARTRNAGEPQHQVEHPCDEQMAATAGGAASAMPSWEWQPWQALILVNPCWQQVEGCCRELERGVRDPRGTALTLRLEGASQAARYGRYAEARWPPAPSQDYAWPALRQPLQQLPASLLKHYHDQQLEQQQQQQLQQEQEEQRKQEQREEEQQQDQLQSEAAAAAAQHEAGPDEAVPLMPAAASVVMEGAGAVTGVPAVQQAGSTPSAPHQCVAAAVEGIESEREQVAVATSSPGSFPVAAMPGTAAATAGAASVAQAAGYTQAIGASKRRYQYQYDRLLGELINTRESKLPLASEETVEVNGQQLRRRLLLHPGTGERLLLGCDVVVAAGVASSRDGAIRVLAPWLQACGARPVPRAFVQCLSGATGNLVVDRDLVRLLLGWHGMPGDARERLSQFVAGVWPEDEGAGGSGSAPAAADAQMPLPSPKQQPLPPNPQPQLPKVANSLHYQQQVVREQGQTEGHGQVARQEQPAAAPQQRLARGRRRQAPSPASAPTHAAHAMMQAAAGKGDQASSKDGGGSPAAASASVPEAAVAAAGSFPGQQQQRQRSHAPCEAAEEQKDEEQVAVAGHGAAEDAEAEQGGRSGEEGEDKEERSEKFSDEEAEEESEEQESSGDEEMHIIAARVDADLRAGERSVLRWAGVASPDGAAPKRQRSEGTLQGSEAACAGSHPCGPGLLQHARQESTEPQPLQQQQPKQQQHKQQQAKRQRRQPPALAPHQAAAAQHLAIATTPARIAMLTSAGGSACTPVSRVAAAPTMPTETLAHWQQIWQTQVLPRQWNAYAQPHIHAQVQAPQRFGTRGARCSNQPAVQQQPVKTEQADWQLLPALSASQQRAMQQAPETQERQRWEQLQQQAQQPKVQLQQDADAQGVHVKLDDEQQQQQLWVAPLPTGLAETALPAAKRTSVLSSLPPTTLLPHPSTSRLPVPELLLPGYDAHAISDPQADAAEEGDQLLAHLRQGQLSPVASPVKQQAQVERQSAAASVGAQQGWQHTTSLHRQQHQLQAPPPSHPHDLLTSSGGTGSLYLQGPAVGGQQLGAAGCSVAGLAAATAGQRSPQPHPTEPAHRSAGCVVQAASRGVTWPMHMDEEKQRCIAAANRGDCGAKEALATYLRVNPQHLGRLRQLGLPPIAGLDWCLSH